jgi:hypothetical protein
VTKQSLQPSTQQDQRVHTWARRKEDLFNFRRGDSLPVIADAHFQPLVYQMHGEAKPPRFRGGLQSVLYGILH